MKIQLDKRSIIDICSLVLAGVVLVLVIIHLGKQNTNAGYAQEDNEYQYYEKDPLHFVSVLNERINYYQMIGDEQSVNRLTYLYDRCVDTQTDCPKTLQEALDY